MLIRKIKWFVKNHIKWFVKFLTVFFHYFYLGCKTFSFTIVFGSIITLPKKIILLLLTETYLILEIAYVFGRLYSNNFPIHHETRRLSYVSPCSVDHYKFNVAAENTDKVSNRKTHEAFPVIGPHIIEQLIQLNSDIETSQYQFS